MATLAATQKANGSAHERSHGQSNGVHKSASHRIDNLPVLPVDMVHKPITDGPLKKPIGCGFGTFQNGQLNGAYDGIANEPTTTATFTSTTVFHTLREASTTVVVQCKKELGAKAEGVLTGTMSMDSLLEFIAAERLRSMPHQGSKWDMVLKWAESLARKVDMFAHAISKFTDQSWEAARLVWGGCWLLLQMSEKTHIIVLEKVMGILHQMGDTLDFFLRHEELFAASSVIQGIMAGAYADMIRLTVGVVIHYKKTHIGAPHSHNVSEFRALFGTIVDSFFRHRDHFSNEVWDIWLKRSAHQDPSITIRTLRKWLTPQDHTLMIILNDNLGTRTARHELTCEWFGSTLSEFQHSKDNVLLVSGRPGSGKSVLAGWILERIKRSPGRNKSQNAISFTIDGTLRSQISSLSVVKSLLLQLLERNAGDLALYKIVLAVYERTERQNVTDDLELAIWNAFNSALRSSRQKLMIVVDGLDQLEGGEPEALKLCERLHDVTKAHTGVKCILISRPLSKPCPSYVRQYAIESINPRDISCFVEYSVSSSHEFQNLKETDKQMIIQRICRAPNVSFVWADLTMQILRREKTFDGICKGLDAVPKALPDLLRKLSAGLDFKQPDTKMIFSWLLVAERPLTLKELKCLFEIDVHSCSHVARFTSIEDDILKACGNLVKIQDGIVHFAHYSVKEFLLDLASSGKFPLSVADAHKELTTRMLAYTKVVLKGSHHEPTIKSKWDSSSYGSLQDLLRKHPFLEYSTRYWVSHFSKSSMYDKSKGKHVCPPEFKSCFPESTLLALIEGQMWETQTSMHDAAWRHSLALDVRKVIQGETHKSVVQCQINLARTYERCSNSVAASGIYFDAWKASRSVSGEKSLLAMACAKSYVSCTKSSTTTTHTEVTTRTVVTKQTEITTRTEEIYKYIWTTSKDIHGAAHEETIEYAKSLALLYTQLKKVELATSIYREVHQVCIEKYGYLHEETVTTSRQLVTILKQTSKHEECVKIMQSMVKATEQTLEVWEQKRISASISMIEVYESQKQLQKAEELLISMTRGIVEACKSRHEDHVHEAKIEITLQYVRFLKRHKREKEAEKILVELWNEFKSPLHDKEAHGDGLLVRIRVIGEEMKKMKLVAVAESVFSSLWGFYKKVSQHTSKEATSIAISLSEILQTKNETHSEETILKEVFEATVTKTTTKSTIETTTVTTCTALSSFYERESRWSEAVHVCSKVLVNLWPSIEASGSDGCYLPHSHQDEAIELAHRLAICHHRERRIDKAEEIYLQILRACKSSLKFQDERVLKAAKNLVGFYESEGMIEKSITVYSELWEEYRVVLGRSHDISIKITYDLARFCEHHQPTSAERFYLEIATALGGRNGEFGAQSIEAVLALCKIYEREKRFRDAQNFYRGLWLTFCNGGRDCGIKVEMVTDIYHNYLRILERQNNFDVIYNLTVQFKETCVKYYGTRHQLTIQSTVQLAKVLERHESRREEAIAIYEEVCEMTAEMHKHTSVTETTVTTSTTTTTVTETTIIEVKERLAKLYSAHTSTASKAEVIYYESWDKVRCKHGYAHEETLSCLSELILFFKKQNTKACIHTATEALQTTIVEIITKEKDTQKLFHSAEAIAKLYIALGMKETALELLKEVRRQLTFTEAKHNKKFKFQLRRGHTIDRRSFVFVMAFEETLNGKSRPTLFTEIMSDLMTETTLYESWMRSQKYGSTFEVTLGIGARLSLFLKAHNREDESNKITDELWELFLSEIGTSESTKRSGILWELFLVCITEMAVEDHDLTVIDTGATLVLSRYEAGAFEGSFELATWICKYVKSRGGFANQQNLTVGFKLALCMAGRHSAGGAKACHDQKLSQKMMELSKSLLKEALKASEQEGMSFSSMPLEEVSLIVSLLGEQRDYVDLERILTSLWNSRKTQPWDSKTIIQLGLRLADVHTANGHAHLATELLQDMSYNLKRVFSILDPQTLACYNHLSAIYTASHQPHKSMAIHGAIIQAALAEDNNSAYADTTAKVVHDQLQLLKRAFQRHGKWDDGERDEEHYRALWDESTALFQETPVWSKKDDIRRWSTKGAAPAGGKDLGFWHLPSEWGFMAATGGKRVSSACGSVHGSVHSVRFSMGSK